MNVMLMPRGMAVRSLASAQPTDPIQKLFVDKIRDYASKAASAPNGLVGANQETSKRLDADIERVANSYGIKDPKNIANLGLKFEDTCKLDPVNFGGK